MYMRQGTTVTDLPVIVPNQWSGERACLVGPFSSKKIAESYAYLFAIAYSELVDEPIVARRDSWYVTVAA